jgi:hypothetical protein
MRSPVVLLIFNRPDVTERVLATVRAARPPRVLVVADGPRPTHPADEALCATTRALIERVDWPCEVLKNYSPTNLGLRTRVSSGLTWAFEQVEEAVVLEDDCLPHPSFFRYCDALLAHYRTDERVMAVSGDNYQQGRRRGSGSYYFSKYITCWGWASWRRGWAKFDLSMSLWPAFRDAGGLRSVCPDPVEHDYWAKIFEDMHAGRVNSWAYAWLFAGFVHSGLSPHPNVNLISNIGFRPDATHTAVNDPVAELPTADLGEIVHPPFVVADREADLFEFDFAHRGAQQRWERTPVGWLTSLPRRVARTGIRWLNGRKG